MISSSAAMSAALPVKHQKPLVFDVERPDDTVFFAMRGSEGLALCAGASFITVWMGSPF